LEIDSLSIAASYDWDADLDAYASFLARFARAAGEPNEASRLSRLGEIERDVQRFCNAIRPHAAAGDAEEEAAEIVAELREQFFRELGMISAEFAPGRFPTGTDFRGLAVARRRFTLDEWLEPRVRWASSTRAGLAVPLDDIAERLVEIQDRLAAIEGLEADGAGPAPSPEECDAALLGYLCDTGATFVRNPVGTYVQGGFVRAEAVAWHTDEHTGASVPVQWMMEVARRRMVIEPRLREPSVSAPGDPLADLWLPIAGTGAEYQPALDGVLVRGPLLILDLRDATPDAGQRAGAPAPAVLVDALHQLFDLSLM
jgi:hypothetical protein